MKTEAIANQLSDLLPEREPVMNSPGLTSDEIEEAAVHFRAKQSAKELARMKMAERRKIKKAEEKQAKARSLGIELSPVETLAHAQKVAEHKARLKAIEDIEVETVEPLSIQEMPAATKSRFSSTAAKALALQGTSRPEMTKLLASLNINLSVQLSKRDTANLLACLLTCNETQLNALLSNKKVPIAIKTIVRRLLEDSKYGLIDTIERLWDRVFGKGPMQLDLPEGQSLSAGIIPNTPISREAYIVIRDTLIK